MNGQTLAALVVLLLAVALIAVVAINYESLKAISASQGAALTDVRAGRAEAVQQLSQEHRELLCVLALDQRERREAVRSRDVCGWLFGTARPHP